MPISNSGPKEWIWINPREKRFPAAQKKDQELEQGDVWAPDSVKLRTKAQDDCERLFLPNFFQPS